MIRLGQKPIPHYVAIGCENCVGGYSGRIGLYEFLTITPEIQHQILNQQVITPSNQISLRQSAEQLIQQGITTLAEINRVLGET